MKPHALCATLLAFTGPGATLLAGPMESTLDPKGIVMEDAAKAVVVEDGSPWFITAGATVRSIDAGFQLDGHHLTPLNWRRYAHRQSGRGDVGLFRGGVGKIQYDDGSVGPGYEYNYYYDGTAHTTINTAGQYRDTGRVDSRGYPIYAATFHTDEYHYQTALDRQSVTVSDSDVGVGPQIQLGRNLITRPSLLVNVVTGWSFVSTDHSSGLQPLANLAVNEKRTVYSYTYDADYGPVGPGNFIEGFPFIDLPDLQPDDSYLIFDVNGGYASGDFRDPRKSSDQSHRTTARFYAVGRSDLDVNLNEIPLGVEVGRQVGAVQVFLTGGATLNVVDYDLTSQVAWYQQGRSRALVTERWRDSDTAVKVGLFGGLVARMPLTGSGNVYLEGHGGYRWVDSVHAAAGFSNVEIDPSSWEGGLGIGIILP